MNKNSKLVSVILSIVALALFATSFVLTKVLEESKAVVTVKETSIILVGAIVSLIGLILNLIDNHKLLKLIPIISYAVFAIYISQFAEDYLGGYGACDAVFNYPVLNFFAIILFAVSAVFMVKDGYKWAKVVFATSASYLSIIIVTGTMGYYFLYEYEGALYVSLYVIAGSVLMLSTLIAGLVSLLPEAEAKEEVKEETKTEEVTEAKEEKVEEAKEESSKDDEAKLDFDDNNN